MEIKLTLRVASTAERILTIMFHRFPESRVN